MNKFFRLLIAIALCVVVAGTAFSTTSIAAANSYESWKQGSDPWGSKKLGDLCTMSDSGCLITSIAILMAKSGAEDPNSFNPGTLRDRYESNGWVSHNSKSKALDGNLSYAAYSKSNSPKFYQDGSSDFHPTPFKDIYSTINSKTSQGLYTVVNVNYGGHYVAVKSCSNGEVYIYDPASSGKTKLSEYDGGIEGAIYFKASASTVTEKPSISGQNSPGTLTKGGKFSVSGTISAKYKLTNVTVGVYDTAGNAKTSKSVNPKATSYDLKNIDKYILFNKLDAGVYKYVVSAKNSKGTVTLVDKKFIVLATGQTISNGTYALKSSVNTKKAISIASNSNQAGANVHLWDYSKSNKYEVWRFTYVSGGYYKISNEGSGLMLDVSGGKSDPGTNVKQYTSNNSNAQLWQVLPDSNGYYYLVPKCGTANCLDLSGGKANNGQNIKIYTSNQAKAQQWQLAPIFSVPKEQKIANGTYSIQSKQNTAYNLDVHGASNKNSANLEVYSGNQTFEVTYLGDGFYKIVSSSSGKAIDVDHSRNLPTTNVLQYEWKASDNQKWYIADAGNGYYYIVSKVNNLVLDIYGGKAYNGCNVCIYPNHAGDGQKWKFEKISKPPKTSLSGVSAQKAAATVKWKSNESKADGYQIQYSTNSKFASGNNTADITSASTNSNKITGLKSKTKYYFRIRTYKQISGRTFYSGWSSSKSVKTK